MITAQKLRESFDAKRKELTNDKQVIDFCLDTQCLVGSLKRECEPEDHDGWDEFYSHVKNERANAETKSYACKWGMDI